MKLIICKNKEEIALKASSFLNKQIIKKPNSILGLATGSSPIRTYELLIEAYKNKLTDWSQITTFNLDEYVGLEKSHPQSYDYFMHNLLFEKLNIKDENINIVSGIGNLKNNISDFQNKLNDYKIDVQLLGLGQNGHIAFNEPGSSFDSEVHVVKLTQNTIDSNARFFDSANEVPKEAITMGIKSIMQAKTILLLTDGAHKAEAVKELVEGKIDTKWPCTILQDHPNVTVIVDQEAASLLNK